MTLPPRRHLRPARNRTYLERSLVARARTLTCALALSVLSLLPGCGDSSDKRIEDQEPEGVREERRMKHEKMAPKGARPAEPGAPQQ